MLKPMFDPITAGDINEGDWVAYAAGSEGRVSQAMQAVKRDAMIGVRWRMEVVFTWLSCDLPVYRVVWIEGE